MAFAVSVAVARAGVHEMRRRALTRSLAGFAAGGHVDRVPTVPALDAPPLTAPKLGTFARLRAAVRDNYRPAMVVWFALWVAPAGGFASAIYASGLEAADVLAAVHAAAVPLQPLVPPVVLQMAADLHDSVLAAVGGSDAKISREGAALLMGALASDLLDPIRLPLVVWLAPRVGRAWRRYRGVPDAGDASPPAAAPATIVLR
jgi:hypothetical protein